MLTITDLQKLEDRLDKKLGQKINKALSEQTNSMFKYFVTKDEFSKEINDLKQQIKRLPSTELFLEWMSKIVGEQEKNNNDNVILNDRTSTHSNQLDDHEIRITKIEKHYLQ